MKLSPLDENNLPSITHALRTAVAATASLIVMQSTLGATLTLSVERIVATAVGASAGALEANYFRANFVA